MQVLRVLTFSLTIFFLEKRGRIIIFAKKYRKNSEFLQNFAAINQDLKVGINTE